MKKVTINPKSHQQSDDDWVNNRSAHTEPMKRINFLIPENLHRKMKMSCAARRTTISEELRTLLVQKYGD